LRYNVGVRWVETDQVITSRVPSANVSAPDGQRLPDLISISTADSTYENILPSANVSWNLTDQAIVRAGVSKTMTRPNPSDMLGGVSIPNNDVNQVNLGNPSLDPYKSDNLDFGFEYYTGQEGYFGVAAFRKGIEGFTQTLTQTVPFTSLAALGITFDSLNTNQQQSINGRGGPNVATVQLRQLVNASGRLTINGLEFNWVQPLDFLLSPLGVEGLGFAANYTIIDQKGEGAAPAIAVGVPPESYNATLYYENFGLSARVSVTHSQGSQTSGPNSNQNSVIGAELFGDDYTQYDFSSSLDFAEAFGWSEMIPQLTLDVVNIGDDARRAYQQFNNATFSYFESGRVVMLGFRGRFD
jgi:TonB-dependent receptor